MTWSSDKPDFFKEVSSPAYLKDPVCSTVSNPVFKPIKDMNSDSREKQEEWN